MRLRTLSAVGAMVLIAAGLTGCRTNVGVAARIDGQRVTESQVSDYLTPKAHAVQLLNNSPTVVPSRSFVVEVLIDLQLFPKLLSLTANGAPSAGQLSTLEAAGVLKGTNAHAEVTKSGYRGFDSSFESKIVDVQQLSNLVNSEAQQGVDFNTLLAKIKFPVSVNPRYGVWDAASAQLIYTADAGVPSFLTLQPSGN